MKMEKYMRSGVVIHATPTAFEAIYKAQGFVPFKEPEPKLDLELEPETETETETEPELEPKPEPETEPELEPKPEPETEPKPDKGVEDNGKNGSNTGDHAKSPAAGRRTRAKS